MTKIDQLRKLYEDDRDYVLKHKPEIAKNIPMDYSSICKAVREWEAKKGKIKAKLSKRNRSGGGIEAFRALYDDNVIIPQIIEDGVEKFLRDTDGEPDWMKDRDFRECCKVSVSKWRRFADDYRHLQVTKNGELFWGHPDIIEEMRRIIQR